MNHDDSVGKVTQSQHTQLLMQNSVRGEVYLSDVDWTEERLLNLVADEHDFVERKGGNLFEGKGSRLKEELSLQLSAFANSGGGYIVLGQKQEEDGGGYDGVPSHYGKTRFKEWLEQVIPNLVDYPLRAFRVHEVVRSTPTQLNTSDGTALGNDKVVIVIEVGDSPLAPHQALLPKGNPKYYCRYGSSKKLAPHHYLELLRTRFVGARLSAELDTIKHFPPSVDKDDVLQFTIGVVLRLTNFAYLACRSWCLDCSLVSRIAWEPIKDGILPVGNHQVIFSTQSILQEVQLRYRMPREIIQQLIGELPTMELRFRAITEHSPAQHETVSLREIPSFQSYYDGFLKHVTQLGLA